MKFNSIRWRLVISYVLLAFLSVSLVGTLTLTLLEGFVKAQTESQLIANAETIAQQANLLMQPAPRLEDLRELAQSVSFLGQMRVRILDEKSHVIVDSGPSQTYTSLVWVQPDPEEINSPLFLIPIVRGLEEQFLQGSEASKDETLWPSIVVSVNEGPWGRDVVFQTKYGEETLYPSGKISSTLPQDVEETKSWASALLPIGGECSFRICSTGQLSWRGSGNTGSHALGAAAYRAGHHARRIGCRTADQPQPDCANPGPGKKRHTDEQRRPGSTSAIWRRRRDRPAFTAVQLHGRAPAGQF